MGVYGGRAIEIMSHEHNPLLWAWDDFSALQTSTVVSRAFCNVHYAFKMKNEGNKMNSTSIDKR